jgi:hypothetical protein
MTGPGTFVNLAFCPSVNRMSGGYGAEVAAAGADELDRKVALLGEGVSLGATDAKDRCCLVDGRCEAEASDRLDSLCRC